MAEGFGINETSPLILTAGLAFFIIASIILERILHKLHHHFVKQRRMGLLTALDNMKNEVMLLGFASLVLLAFEDTISGWCVRSDNHFVPSVKFWMDSVPACSCCLTQFNSGATDCYIAYRGCPGISTLSQLEKYCDSCGIVNELTVDVCPAYNATVYGNYSKHSSSDASSTDSGRHLLAPTSSYSTPECIPGTPFQKKYTECGYREGYRPLITVAGLHQLDIFIFSVAFFHIVIATATIAVAYFRINKWWAPWNKNDEQARIVHAHVSTQATLHSPHKDQQPPAAAAAAAAPPCTSPGSVIDPEQQIRDAASSDSHTDSHDQRNNEVTEAAIFVHPLQRLKSERWFSARIVPTKLELSQDVVNSMKPEVYRSSWDCVKECLRIAGRLLWPIAAIKREEFSLLRAAFFLTHHISSAEFSFVKYCNASMEDDYAKIVGIGLDSWTIVGGFFIISTWLGFQPWVLLCLAGMLLLAVNAKLIYMVRHFTRGAIVRRHSAKDFWYGSPTYMLWTIKFALFMLAFTFSNNVYFAFIQGTRSCFFYLEHILWIVTLVVNVIMLFSLGFTSLPLYSLIVQLHTEAKRDSLRKYVEDEHGEAAAAGLVALWGLEW